MFLKRTSIFALAAATLITASSALADDFESTKEAPNPTLGPGEAGVYIMRPAGMGMAISFWAFVDETLIGVTKGNSYTFAAVPAGEHLLWSSSGNVSAINVTLEAGKFYYFEQKVKMGGLKARVSLEPMAEADARESFGKEKYTTLTDEGRAKGAEELAEHHAEAVEIAAAPPAE
jgi:hypothetical protein